MHAADEVLNALFRERRLPVHPSHQFWKQQPTHHARSHNEYVVCSGRVHGALREAERHQQQREACAGLTSRIRGEAGQRGHILRARTTAVTSDTRENASKTGTQSHPLSTPVDPINAGAHAPRGRVHDVKNHAKLAGDNNPDTAVLSVLSDLD